MKATRSVSSVQHDIAKLQVNIGGIGLGMKTIIAGSRQITNLGLLEQVIEQCGFKITTVISGCAKGVDELVETWANKHDIPVFRYPAQWKKYGRGAGPVQNKEMADNAEACIVIWDGQSKGSKSMIDLARKMGLLLYVRDILAEDSSEVALSVKIFQ